MKLQENFGYTIVNNIPKSQKLSIILLGFIGLAPNDHPLNPYFFQAHSEIQQLRFCNLGLALISSLMLTFTSEIFLGLLANTLSFR